jgi:serine/threonine protein kinase
MTLKTIKHFTFDESKKLGEGSTGTVYLGTDLRNNSPIAVKAIDLKNIDNEVTQYLLKNEIKALRMTNHPNVLKAIDVIQEP